MINRKKVPRVYLPGIVAFIFITLPLWSLSGEPGENAVLAHWSFDSTDHYYRFYDVSGNGFHATCSKHLSTNKGVKGRALESTLHEYAFFVDNSKDGFAVPTFSIEVWIYSYIDLVNIGSFYEFKTILSYQTFSPGRSERNPDTPAVAKGYDLDITDSGKVQLSMANADAKWISCIGTTVLKPHRWYHLVGTYDGNVMKVYVNGTLEASVAQPSGYIKPDQDANIACQAQLKGIRRNWFNGMIDELTVYNYPLDNSVITEHYEALLPEEQPPFDINLGMKTVFAHAGDTVVMPVYFSNHEQYALNIVQVVLSYDPLQLNLLSISKDSGLVNDWEFFDWYRQAEGSVPVTIADGTMKLGYEDGEIFRTVFSVSKKSENGEVCTIAFEDLTIDKNKDLIVATAQDGRIVIAKEPAYCGDVSGDNEVTVHDALIVLNYIVGAITLPDDICPNFSRSIADVTGNGLITSYDASFIQQYSIGLIPYFPVLNHQSPPEKRQDETAPSGDIAHLDIRITSGGTDELTYEFIGSNLRNFCAGEFSIECTATGDLISSGTITTTLPGAKISSKYISDDHRLNIAIITNDDVDTDDTVTIARITLPPATETERPRFTIKSALLNDGAIATTYADKPIASVKYRKAITAAPEQPAIFFRDKRLIVQTISQTTASFSLYDLLGRQVTTTLIKGKSAEIPTEKLGRTTCMYMLRQNGTVTTGKIVNVDVRH